MSAPRPPRVWSAIARLLVRGSDAPFILCDLDEAYRRDMERDGRRGWAGRRYAANVVGSVLRVGFDRLVSVFTHGAWLDAKLGFRMLTKQPLLTVVAMLALGLGIPATVSVRHLLDAIYRPLPVPEGERVVGLRYWDLERSAPVMSSLHDYETWRASLTTVAAVAAVRPYSVNLRTGDSRPAPVSGADITASGFDLLRVPPILGRTLDARDEQADAPAVVVIGEDLWRGRFASDPEILGATVNVGREPHTVIGVMPSDFEFPFHQEVWRPLRDRAVDHEVGEGPGLFVFARLADERTLEEADLEVGLVAERLVDEYPEVYERLSGRAVTLARAILQDGAEDSSAHEIRVIESILLVLLLVVCGNVGLLVLARTATRMGEISVRTALGASRARIVSQIFTEAMVLALVATGCGLVAAEAVAIWVSRLIEPFGFFPYWVDLTLGWETVMTSLVLASLAAVVAGVLPALRATNRGVQANLQRSAAGRTTMRFGAGSTVLIVTEVMISVGFLAVGGVMVRSFFQDTDSALGFDPSRYVASGVGVPWIDPGSDSDAHREPLAEFQRGVLDGLAADSEVLGVGLASTLPGSTGNIRRIYIETHESLEEPPRTGAGSYRVQVDFFEGLNRPILSGRDFAASDVLGAPVAIVNEAFAEDWLGGRSPLGLRFRYATRDDVPPDEYVWYEIVGVVGAFGVNPNNPTRSQGAYHPLPLGDRALDSYMIEVAGDPDDFVPRFREIVAEVDPTATVVAPLSLVDRMRRESRAMQMLALGQVALAGIAFLLSISGLYALMSFTVMQRTREIGIRSALGAHASSIVRTIAQRAALQLAMGLVLGAGCAWWMLHEIVVGDASMAPINVPVTIGVTLAISAAIGVLGCAAPTIRGLRIQPNEALRSD